MPYSLSAFRRQISPCRFDQSVLSHRRQKQVEFNHHVLGAFGVLDCRKTRTDYLPAFYHYRPAVLGIKLNNNP